jgi:putative copper resistance protein D
VAAASSIAIDVRPEPCHHGGVTTARPRRPSGATSDGTQRSGRKGHATANGSTPNGKTAGDGTTKTAATTSTATTQATNPGRTTSSRKPAGPPSSSRQVTGQQGGDVWFAGLTRSASVFVVLLAAAEVVAAVVGTGATDLPPITGLDDPGPIVQFGIPISRTLLDICAVAAAGVAILARLLGFDEPAKTEPVMRQARRVGLWASVGWTVAALLSIVLLTAELHPGSFPSPGAIWAYVSNIAAGKGLLLSAACGLASAFLAWLSLRHGENVPAELRAGIALFGLLPLPLTGHASNWAYHDLSMVVMELHVVTASAWAGTLGAVIVFLARRPELLSVALPRYSRLATWCVLIVGATGVFTGLLELALSPVTSLPESLWNTRFGVLVLVKAGLFAVIAAVAIFVRSRLLPMIAAGRRTAVAVWCGWELIVLALAFGVAVVLTRASVTPF